METTMITRFESAIRSMTGLYRLAQYPNDGSVHRDILKLEENIRYTFGDEEAEAIFTRAQERAREEPA